MMAIWIPFLAFFLQSVSHLEAQVTTPTLCFTCSSALEGQPGAPPCPLDEPVDPALTRAGPCMGSCVTRGRWGAEPSIERGCSSAMSDLPTPLPEEEGCSIIGTDTLCVCRGVLCNISPLESLTSPDVLNPPVDPNPNTTPNPGPDTNPNPNPNTDPNPNSNSSQNPVPNPNSNTGQNQIPNPNPDPNPNPNPLPNPNPIPDPTTAPPANPYPDDEPGVLYCVQCINYDADGNYYSQCPRNEPVDLQRAYTANCTGACFTRTMAGDKKTVYRGCTSTQWGLPHPLPADGCYKWRNNDDWCLCRNSRCNSAPMGLSSGIEMDQHLYDSDVPVIEEDGIHKCYQCVNYDLDGNYYAQCPKDTRVRNAYFAPCNGTCFTRSYDYNVSKVARGCSDSQWGLPNPLPPDGCYSWYSDVWCVCSTSRCNGAGLGKSSGVEFDAHIPKEDSASINKGYLYSYCLVIAAVNLIMVKYK